MAYVFHREVTKIQRQAWRDFCSTLDYHTDARKVTKVINSLTDTESKQSANILHHPITQTIQTTPSECANAHSIYFASVSHKPVILPSNRPAFNVLKQKVDDYLNTPDPSPDVTPFSLAELKLALKKLHDRRAPGDDCIYTELLHSLHHPVLRVILKLANCIWESGDFPSSF